MSGSISRLTSTIDVAGRIVAEDFAVRAADRFPVADDVGDIHAGADDLLQRRAGALERALRCSPSA